MLDFGTIQALRLLPCPNFASSFIKESLVIFQTKSFACIRGQEREQRFVCFIDPQILLLILGRHFISAEQESARMAVD